MNKDLVLALIAFAAIAGFLFSQNDSDAMATCLQTHSADTCNYTLR